MNHCAVTSDLNRYMRWLDAEERRDLAIEQKLDTWMSLRVADLQQLLPAIAWQELQEVLSDAAEDAVDATYDDVDPIPDWTEDDSAPVRWRV